ncbi:MAG: siderophore ABC transporter substrate-binding protein [Comamonas sp.]
MSRSSLSAVNRRQSLLQLGALVTLPWAAGAASAQTFTVQQSNGTVQIPRKPQTILVYDMAALDCLRALGAQVKGVPEVVKFPPVLEQYASKDYARIGSLFEPDYEAVKALKPDVIVAGGRSAAKVVELSKIAPTLDLTVDNTKPVESAFKHLKILGQMVGNEAKADVLIRAMQADIDTLKGVTQGKGTGLMIMTNGGKLSAYGPGSRFGMIHDVYGIPAANKDIKVSGHGQAISFEFILKTNPDWLFVLDRDAAIGREGASASRLLDNPLVNATKAAKKKQIVYLNSANWYLLGNASPGSLHDDVTQLIEAFSKAAKV